MTTLGAKSVLISMMSDATELESQALAMAYDALDVTAEDLMNAIQRHKDEISRSEYPFTIIEHIFNEMCKK